MQIIIPMTGYGSRFVAAGYKDLKPLIEVQGRRMVDWIVSGMYRASDSFTFICRAEHLNTITWLEDYLKSLAPNVRIFAVDNWTKLGPVADVIRAQETIEDQEPVIINYCDFYMEWDCGAFIDEAAKRNCDGAVPCYSGFHPNLLPQKNLYASCLVDKYENLVEIKEKFSFTKDKTLSRHSPGVYYFKSGELCKKYLKKLMDSGQTLNGEFYASLPYNFMVKDGLKVWCPVCVKHFCQWGTPEDLQDYIFWTNTVRSFGHEL